MTHRNGSNSSSSSSGNKRERGCVRVEGVRVFADVKGQAFRDGWGIWSVNPFKIDIIELKVLDPCNRWSIFKPTPSTSPAKSILFILLKCVISLFCMAGSKRWGWRWSRRCGRQCWGARWIHGRLLQRGGRDKGDDWSNSNKCGGGEEETQCNIIRPSIGWK